MSQPNGLGPASPIQPGQVYVELMMRARVNVSAKPRCASTIIHLIQTDKLLQIKILHAMHCFACPANHYCDPRLQAKQKAHMRSGTGR
jgi:hypothetical protein